MTTLQVMWIYREVTSPLYFIVAQIQTDIIWRTKRFRLKWGGLVEPMAGPAGAAMAVDKKAHL